VDTVNEHGVPSWLTVTVCPAIVTAAERAEPALASMARATGPLPVPAAPEVTWIHDAVVAAVHVQPASVVTVMVPVVAAAAAAIVVADSWNEHDGAS